jgi:hypothetical protein
MAIYLNKAWGHKMKVIGLLTPLNKMERMTLLFSVLFVSLQDFLNEWIWHPTWMLGLLLVVLFADLCTGIALSLRRGEGISTRKFTTWCFTVAGFIFLLGVMYNMPRVNTELGLFPMVSPILSVISRCFYLMFLLNPILSAMKNLVLVGALKGPLALFAIKYIDTYKNKAEDLLLTSIKKISPEVKND